MPRYSKRDIAESVEWLRRVVPAGTTVYTTLRHVSRSGMMREISLYVIKRGGGYKSTGEPVSITFHVARALGYSLNRGGSFHALRVSGCGMDMGFHVVNSLSYKLHGKDRGEGAKPENAGRPFRARRGHYRAGYSLNHEWV